MSRKAPKRRAYAGRGAYKEAPLSRATGDAMGAQVGSAVGLIPGVGSILGPAASWLASRVGGYLGNKLGSYMGWGDYKVNRNSLIIPEGNSPAAMHSSGQTTRVCHREYIGDVISSSVAGAFNLNSYKLQPGDDTVFPWLADIANNFQKYKLLGAIIEFKSGSGDAITGSNTALGEVIISTNYNNADPNFISRNQMENTQYCSSAKPSVSFVHIIECDPELQSQESLYVSPSSVPEVGLTVNEINWANVQVATIGCQGTSVNLGSLYITYDIELIQPLEKSVSRVIATDWFAGTVASVAAPFGSTTPAKCNKNSIGGRASTGTYFFPDQMSEGLYFVEILWVGGSVTFAAPTPGGTNVTFPSLMQSFTNPYDAVGLTTAAMMAFCVQVNARGAFFVLTGGTIPTSSAAYLKITPLDRDFADSSAVYVPQLASPYFQIPEPTTMRICDEHKASETCEDAGDSEVIHRLKQRIKELQNQTYS
jgi:hypothetical protein